MKRVALLIMALLLVATMSYANCGMCGIGDAKVEDHDHEVMGAVIEEVVAVEGETDEDMVLNMEVAEEAIADEGTGEAAVVAVEAVEVVEEAAEGEAVVAEAEAVAEEAVEEVVEEVAEEK